MKRVTVYISAILQDNSYWMHYEKPVKVDNVWQGENGYIGDYMQNHDRSLSNLDIPNGECRVFELIDTGVTL